MKILTKKQIERQDFVDNAINNLIQELNPTEAEINWDIDMIGEIRDIIQLYFIDLKICSETEFYPNIIDE
ncbi:MAG TPA: hypothetical protein PLQ44_03545 [Candidatus Paceibacterota bacterium]|nr:hypothetical protein [Candidatus Paceibacterota bacterium]